MNRKSVQKPEGSESQLLQLLFGHNNGFVERQEAEGQKSFVQSDTLPIKCPRQELEALGFIFGENQDDLFVYVTMPDGWHKDGTSHSMWSRLIDHKGRERGSIFYKAAFYDRAAHMSLSRRFNCGHKPMIGYEAVRSIPYEEQEYIGIITDNALPDGERVIWQTEPIWGGEEWYKVGDTLDEQSREKLTEMYPDWQNVLAYWD